MIKREPDTNLISRSKTFVLELLNRKSSCKPEQSADEKSSFFTSSTFFGRPSGVTGISDKYCSQDSARWIMVGLEISMKLATLTRREYCHCDVE